MSAPKTKAEKADEILRDYLAAVQSGDFWASDFAAWLLRDLKPSAIKKLAEEYDEQQRDAE
jgi:hypothetical protein